MLISFDPIKRFGKIGEIKKREVGKHATIKRSGMRFDISSYEIDGVGFFSKMTTKAFFGLMKMETIVFTPVKVDMPLMSYDIMHMPGKDMILLELYDTMVGKADLSSLGMIKERYDHLPDRPVPNGWSKKMMLPQSVDKMGKGIIKEGDTLITEWIEEYLLILSDADKCEENEKIKATRRYTDGLFKEGGPAVDQFKKMLGEEEAVKLLGEFIFSSDTGR